MSAPKDIGIAMDVQQMAAYGYFNEEFLFYSYAFTRGEQIVYKLSESLLSIYSAYHYSVFDDVYPTPVCSLLKSVIVPSGEQAAYKTQFKMELIENIRQQYGQPFYDALLLFQNTPSIDSAYPLLTKALSALSPKAEKRQFFDGLCQQALEAKLLTPLRHSQLMRDADRLYGQQRTVIKPLAGRGKAFSGFAYRSPKTSETAFYTSATLEETYSKYHKLRQQGLVCTPIVQKSYWYDSPNDFKAIRQAFTEFLIQLTDECQALALVEALRALPSAVNPTPYQMFADKLASSGSPQANAAFCSYGVRYHLF